MVCSVCVSDHCRYSDDTQEESIPRHVQT